MTDDCTRNVGRLGRSKRRRALIPCDRSRHTGCDQHAARAQCLKQVRDSHMLYDLGFPWDEFCTLHAGISRRHADNLIHQYERFGDAYFRRTEIAPVSPKTFHQIAAQVTPDTIEIEGQPLALPPMSSSCASASMRC